MDLTRRSTEVKIPLIAIRAVYGDIYTIDSHCLHVIMFSAIAIVSMMPIDTIYSYKISLLFATIFTNKNDFRSITKLFGKKTRF